jgi:hypothetical protein
MGGLTLRLKRYLRISLPPVHYHSGKESIKLWLVQALKEKPPDNVQPVEKFLLTTIKITSGEEAVQCLALLISEWLAVRH